MMIYYKCILILCRLSYEFWWEPARFKFFLSWQRKCAKIAVVIVDLSRLSIYLLNLLFNLDFISFNFSSSWQKSVQRVWLYCNCWFIIVHINQQRKRCRANLLSHNDIFYNITKSFKIANQHRQGKWAKKSLLSNSEWIILHLV